MTYVPATSGGFSDTVSRPALTMSESQREVPLRRPRFAGVSSGFGNNAAGNSSIHEEQHNGFAIPPVHTARNVANAVGSSALDRTLTIENGMLSQEERDTFEDMNAANSRSSRSMLEIETDLIRLLSREDSGQLAATSSQEGQSPPEDMLAASTGSSNTMASELGSDVVDAPLTGASQQIGDVVAGSSTGSTMTENGFINPQDLMSGADNSANTMANTVVANPLAGPAHPAVTMDADKSINNDALPPVTSGNLVGEAPAIGQMGADNSANYQSVAQQTNYHVDQDYASTLMPAAMQPLPASMGSSAAPMAGPAQNNVSFGGYDHQPQQTGAGSSVNYPVAENAALSGFNQSQMHMGVDNSVNNTVAYDATLGGFNQPQMYMGVDNSVNVPVADNATLGGFNQPQMQNGAGNSTTNFNFAASSATPSGNMPPQMPNGAGNSTYNFGGQQYDLVVLSQQANGNGWSANMNGQQLAPNGGYQGFHPQMTAAAQAYSYPGAAANAGPLNGGPQGFNPQSNAAPQYSYNGAAAQAGPLDDGMGYYGQQPAQPAAPAPVSMPQQQPALDGNIEEYRQQWWAAAPQHAAARTRRAQGDDSAPRKRRRTRAARVFQALAGPAGPPAPAVQQAPAQQQVLVQQQVPVQQAPVQQQVPAQQGPYAYTANGVPNVNPTKKGNAQGQAPHWAQALKHHNRRCDRFKLDGCVPDCELRLRWPLTWASWNTRRFQIRWETARPERPQIEQVSGFFANAQNSSPERFVVVGEVRADGSVDPQKKKAYRVERQTQL